MLLHCDLSPFGLAIGSVINFSQSDKGDNLFVDLSLNQAAIGHYVD